MGFPATGMDVQLYAKSFTVPGLIFGGGEGEQRILVGITLHRAQVLNLTSLSFISSVTDQSAGLFIARTFVARLFGVGVHVVDV